MSDFNIGFVIFPNLTQLDFTGPLQVLHRMPGAATHIVAKSLDPVPSDCGLGLLPTVTLRDCPQLDLICVPGGFGVVRAMTDPETVSFVKRQAIGASYISSEQTPVADVAPYHLNGPMPGLVHNRSLRRSSNCGAGSVSGPE